MQLIPFDEVSRRLALSRRTYLGLQEIPVERIVGSVDRSDDFRRDFRPQRRLSRGRLASLRSAFPDGDVPAISVFEVGGAYPLRAGVGISFAGEVAYARMLHAELRDHGIHVGHTAIGGSIAPGGDHEPDDVADVLWRHHTERSDFQVSLGID